MLRRKRARQSHAACGSRPSWRVSAWQDGSEPRAKSVLEKSFRAICSINRSRLPGVRSCARGVPCVGVFIHASGCWGRGREGVCTQLSFCSPSMSLIFQESLNSPRGRETAASLNRCACRGRVLLSECCQEPPSALVQTSWKRCPESKKK